MTNIFLSLVLIAVFLCVLSGWGNVARWMISIGHGNAVDDTVPTTPAPATTPGSWTVTMALGLALLIALGGVINLVRLANIWSLSALTVLGLGLCLAMWIQQSVIRSRPVSPPRQATTRAEFTGRSLMLALVLAILVFTLATQLPPARYNFGDDLQKYFAHPVRMLATGTLFGSPLSAMGSESLGGMAFLHGFVAAWLPLTT
jgi:hypothetical protein